MSNASHAKEPSMEEILASIRRIIESSDERPSLPGLSVTPRQPRTAAPEAPPQAANAAVADGVPAPSDADAATARLGPLGDVDDPAPLRIFQPANGMLAEPDPFEELATWEFAPVDMPAASSPAAPLSAAGPQSPRRADETPAPVVTAADGPIAQGFGDGLAMVSAMAEGDVSAAPIVPASLPLRRAASLSEAYGAARSGPVASSFPPELGAPASAAIPQAAVQVAGNSVASGDDAEVFVLAAAASAAADGAAQVVAPAPDADFSLEFDEDAFSEELRGTVLSGSATLDTVSDDRQAGRPPLAETSAASAAAPAAEKGAFVSLSSVMTETSSLMSAEAGSQVAAAFDDLARAIRDGQMKSMEEMAREMLRPMLQEWLDDNLPRLVEKLVREEIERVARGGRR